MKTLTRSFGILCVALCAVALTACEDKNNVSGNLIVNQTMDVESKEGRQSIAAGKYKSELTMSDKGSMLKVMPDGSYDTMIEVPFGGLKENQMGPVDIDNGTTKQPFGVKGEIKHNVYEATWQETQSCLHHYEHRVECGSVASLENGDDGVSRHYDRDRDDGWRHRPNCRHYDFAVYGRQDLERDVRVTDKIIDLGFVDGATGAALGNFYAKYQLDVTTLDRRYLGVCHL